MSGSKFRFPAMVALVAAMVFLKAAAAQCQVLGPLTAQWNSTRDLILHVVEVVPEDKYDFKPTPEVRSFREQFVHIVGENYLFMGFVTGDKPGDPARFDNLKTKAEITKALTDSYEYGSKALAALTEQTATQAVPAFRGQPMQRWAIAMMNIADNMDHYGNLVVYMRLNGIVPPRSAPR